MSAVPDRLAAALADRYRLEREIGQGGMATVFMAEDLKHDRKVAIKVLKPELAAVLGADRFLQEIKTTAQLQHPHILPLFDSGTADGFLYYVMPYVEGESLRDRLNREKQLPVQEAVDLTAEVADALEYAHEHGVVHRDIKPENILIHAGRPMVADFGIALAVSAAAGGRMTETGLSLGTPHYMSPEQATAEKEITGRSDVYSLASVLYEMLTGDPPHVGSSAQQIIMKIVTEEAAPVTKLRRSVPPNVAAAVSKALEKLPADRFGSAKEFAEALADQAFRHGGPVGARATAPRHWKGLTIALGAAAVLLAAALGWRLLGGTGPEPAQPMRFHITPDSGWAVPTGANVRIALSSDGRKMVYVGAAADSGTRLWLRSFDRLDAEPIPGTAGASAPALSVDGQRLAFKVGMAIYVTDLDGGPVRRIVEEGYDPAWGDDGTLYFANDQVIYRLREGAGAPEAFTSTSGGQQTMPSPLPGGRGLLVSVVRGLAGRSRIAVVGPDGGAVREILDGTMARYAASGQIVYTTSEGTLLAAPFDLRSLEAGPSVAVVAHVRVEASSHAQFALSRNGTLVYEARPEGASRPADLVWVSRTGVATPLDSAWTKDAPEGPDFMALSPDGTRLAIGTWVKPLDGGPGYQLPSSPAGHPSWTPDGDSLLIDSSDSTALTRMADGSGQAVQTWHDARGVIAPNWSPDRAWLVYRTNFNLAGNGDILAVRPARHTAPRAVAATAALELSPALSPDGHWLAYTSDQSGRDEVYVTSFPDTARGRWRISDEGGTGPLWARSGRELFYRGPQGAMVAVQVRTAPVFSEVSSRILFEGRDFASGRIHPLYDVAHDDRRFLMWRYVGRARPDRLILVQNFFEELREKVKR
jgi:Tol biopolymer transport system component/tRNA A-37 threonylcarbamoyl transferase component Bud32